MTRKVTLCILLAVLLSHAVLAAPHEEQETEQRAGNSTSLNENIKHWIVLVMENRSFDHMLGWLHESLPDLEGLTGDEYNLMNVGNPSSEKVYVNKDGFDISPSDPSHTLDSTTEQIYGFEKKMNETAVPKMNGFVQNAAVMQGNTSNPMSMFTEAADSAPVLNTLAREFVVFDHWFASLPGPTDPNRGFIMSGTSNGMDTNFNGTLWNQQSYFDQLTQAGISWRGYFQIDPWALLYFEDTHYPDNIKNMRLIDRFFLDLQNDNLPTFSFLQPQMNTHRNPPNWQHPDASVKEGERLIKSVYEHLRNSSYWESSVLLITYDEHGGFYDHVSPPQFGIPSPDGQVAPDGFTFERLGIRVPCVVVSPFAPKGLIVHEPVSKPTPTSHFDHTSIQATTNLFFNISQPLSNRVAWAGTFENIFSLESPRTDCPETLPELPMWTQKDLEEQWARPLNDHIEIQIQFYCRRNHPGQEECGKNITNQLEASLFIEAEVETYLKKHCNYSSEEGCLP